MTVMFSNAVQLLHEGEMVSLLPFQTLQAWYSYTKGNSFVGSHLPPPHKAVKSTKVFQTSLGLAIVWNQESARFK